MKNIKIFKTDNKTINMQKKKIIISYNKVYRIQNSWSPCYYIYNFIFLLSENNTFWNTLIISCWKWRGKKFDFFYIFFLFIISGEIIFLGNLKLGYFHRRSEHRNYGIIYETQPNSSIFFLFHSSITELHALVNTN